MLLRVPASQSKTCLGSLILQISGQDFARLFVRNVIGLVVIVKKMAIVRVAILIIG